jgi:hypothetical protein
LLESLDSKVNDGNDSPLDPIKYQSRSTSRGGKSREANSRGSRSRCTTRESARPISRPPQDSTVYVESLIPDTKVVICRSPPSNIRKKIPSTKVDNISRGDIVMKSMHLIDSQDRLDNSNMFGGPFHSSHAETSSFTAEETIRQQKKVGFPVYADILPFQRSSSSYGIRPLTHDSNDVEYKEVNRLNDAKARNIDLYRHIFHDDNYVKEIQDKYEGKLDVTERLILPTHRAFSRTKARVY